MKVGLIDNWGHGLWAYTSTKVGWAAGVATVYFSANPEQWYDLNSHLPWWGHILVGLGVALVSNGSRVLTFKKKPEGDE